ncbi:methyl-accepting chemotaxis protein [Thiomicrorhabdus xiamenensis]|uniref:PAS domain-containing methyl-accepting chemotaxis protein n=1 Tax=Thiomicrorhabdus xiamenensis TaxID=2739063 RepID=A0A7D4TA03_9GAMM|nr:PAS domain-containing methyl-accepting chemotaxis protein [Thiomicrorhabdus xiamenensis]QKI88886.1 PAS domain-containing methyl-accepting chemotaxis protein [Thiomicrorhabdus xiamenensis]
MFNAKFKNQIQLLHKQTNDQQQILNALDRVMATIEFDLNGNIINANENFLHTVGYTLEEVRGKHHRLFVYDKEASSPDYQRFWQRLAQGEFITGRFKRKNKQGETVWLEASYNPVVDESGKLVKFIKFATDITDQVRTEYEAKAQIEAIHRVMAVIEFDAHGNILTANDNFLQTMNYSLQEIKGKHHRIFALSEFADSDAYRDFWNRLARGESFSGTFQRIDKNGQEVWLEASYNPILDPDGQVCKVIKYASDIGSNPNSKLLDAVIMDASKVIESVSNGNLTVKMASHRLDDPTMYDKNIELLNHSIENMCHKLSGVIQSVDESAGEFAVSSRQIVSSSQSLNQQVQESASRLQQTSESMNQTNHAIENSSKEASAAAQIAADVQSQTKQGVRVMNDTVQAMDAIQESSKKISEIVSLIDGIAFQTNLLALNAAVEAARAGEHGRGFAVVAGEVRALAQKSAEAAKDIKNLIEETVQRVNEGSSLANESGEMLNQINSSIQEVGDKIQQVARNAVSQAQETELAYQSLLQVEQIMQRNAELASESSESAQSMAQGADELKNEMAYFQYTLNEPAKALLLPRLS